VSEAVSTRDAVATDGRHGTFAAFTALAVAGALWGTGFLFGKIALEALDVAHMILYRFLFACIALAPLALRARVRIRREDMGTLVIAGVLGVPVQFLVQFAGLARTTVSHASLMVGVMPVLLALAAMLVFGERLDGVGWGALLAATAGAILIALSTRVSTMPGGPSLAGDVLVVSSLLAAVGWVLLSKRLMRRYPPTAVTVYIVLIGSAFLAAWTIVTDGLPPAVLPLHIWGALAAQGVLATAVTMVLWNHGIARVPASHASVFINLEPVVGALLGVVVLHETLGAWGMAGGALIVAAAVVLTWRGVG